MVKARAQVTLAEVAGVVTQTFDGLPVTDLPEVREVARVVRKQLLDQFRAAFGPDWERAWNYVAERGNS